MSPKAYCLEKIILLIWFLSLNLNTVDFKLSRTKNFHVCFISAQNMRKGLTILQAVGGRVFNIPSYCKTALKPSNMPLNTPKFQFFSCLGLRDPFYFAQTVSGGCNLRGGGRIILYKTLTYLFSNFCDDQFIKQLISVNNWANEQMTLTYGLQWHQQFIIVDVGYDWCLKSSILTLTVRHSSCCISWGGVIG